MVPLGARPRVPREQVLLNREVDERLSLEDLLTDIERAGRLSYADSEALRSKLNDLIPRYMETYQMLADCYSRNGGIARAKVYRDLAVNYDDAYRRGLTLLDSITRPLDKMRTAAFGTTCGEELDFSGFVSSSPVSRTARITDLLTPPQFNTCSVPDPDSQGLRSFDLGTASGFISDPPFAGVGVVENNSGGVLEVGNVSRVVDSGNQTSVNFPNHRPLFEQVDQHSAAHRRVTFRDFVDESAVSGASLANKQIVEFGAGKVSYSKLLPSNFFSCSEDATKERSLIGEVPSKPLHNKLSPQVT